MFFIQIVNPLLIQHILICNAWLCLASKVRIPNVHNDMFKLSADSEAWADQEQEEDSVVWEQDKDLAVR